MIRTPKTLMTGAVLALAAPLAAAADLDVWYETLPAGHLLSCQLDGASGSQFAVLGSIAVGDNAPGAPALLGLGALDGEGAGTLQMALPAGLLPLPEDVTVSFRAVHKLAGELIVSAPAGLVLGEEPATDVLDFHFAIGPDDALEMQAGRVISEQWADAGLHVSADNRDVHHPDKAILFDTNDPTGGDDDLGVGLGLGLIIAENDVDADGDGLVDDPDDEQKGGSLFFDFDEPATIRSVRLVDIDEHVGTQLRFYRDGDLDSAVDVVTVLSQGDGAVQDVFFHEERVDRFEIHFKGSGLVAGLQAMMCPRTIDFDETTLGIPLGLQAGEWITDDLAHLGVTVSAVNNHPLHPQKAILFDTANPTGGDFDLQTPHPTNDSNDEALGMVFILAENDVDADGDGLVDDPDDEMGGGQIRFDFDVPSSVFDLRLLDCDENEVDLVYCLDAFETIVDVIVVPDQPDGSVQLVPVHATGISSLIVDLGGSGAVAHLRFCPDPKGVD